MTKFTNEQANAKAVELLQNHIKNISLKNYNRIIPSDYNFEEKTVLSLIFVENDLKFTIKFQNVDNCDPFLVITNLSGDTSYGFNRLNFSNIKNMLALIQSLEALDYTQRELFNKTDDLIKQVQKMKQNLSNSATGERTYLIKARVKSTDECLINKTITVQSQTINDVIRNTELYVIKEGLNVYGEIMLHVKELL